MRILFLGDVVGRTGRETVAAALPGLRAALRIDLAIVNAENASHGFGLGPDMAAALFAAGADVITLGNHAWDRKEIIPYIAETPRLIRALNFPPGTPGGGSVIVVAGGRTQGAGAAGDGPAVHGPAGLPVPRHAAGTARQRLGVPSQGRGDLVDFHAEATSEKMAFAHSFDGQVSLIVGTHTHCPSADARCCPAARRSSPMLGCAATTTA